MSREIFCGKCEMFTPHREKMDAAKYGSSVCDKCDTMNVYCVLLKPEDVSFVPKTSKAVLWLEFNEDRTFKEQYNKPAIDRSLIMSPFNHFFTWQTTPITEIIEEKPGYVKFNTENSLYELYYPIEIENEETEDVQD